MRNEDGYDRYERKYRNEYRDDYDDYGKVHKSDYDREDSYKREKESNYRDISRDVYEERYRAGYYNEKDFWRSFKILRTISLIMCAIAVVFISIAVYTTKMNPGDRDTASDKKTTGYNSESAKSSVTQPTLDSNQSSQEEVDDAISSRAAEETEPGIVVDCRAEIYANAGQTTIRNINLTNDAVNTNYYMTYELRLPDNSAQGYEVLFKTDLITPGHAILDIELSRPMESGNYKCILMAQPYYISSCTPTNNLNTGVTLIVS